MLKQILVFLLFPFMCVKGVVIEPVPDWVKPCEFPLDIAVQSSHIHEQQLLLDRQQHWEKEAINIHSATKAIDEIGAGDFSQLRFHYDPSYQKIIVHTLRLYRQGEWINRLENSRHELIQKEDKLD